MFIHDNLNDYLIDNWQKFSWNYELLVYNFKYNEYSRNTLRSLKLMENMRSIAVHRFGMQSHISSSKIIIISMYSRRVHSEIHNIWIRDGYYFWRATDNILNRSCNPKVYPHKKNNFLFRNQFIFASQQRSLAHTNTKTRNVLIGSILCCAQYRHVAKLCMCARLEMTMITIKFWMSHEIDDHILLQMFM